MKVSISPFELERAKRDIARSLAEIRATGTVEILEDIEGIAAVIRFTPLPPADGVFDDKNWGAVREPTKILIDPLKVFEPALRRGA